ncbi:MAG: glycosyl hydrolase [Asgard group archaeon]|nr:glycosyl hydrolase [Asgard group archaeon]
MAKKLSKRFLKKYPYFNDELDLDERVSLLLSRLTLQEKFRLLSGRHGSLWTTKPIRRLKIKRLGMTDGPNGVGLHSGLRFSTKFPCSKCLSATWDKQLAKAFGVAAAKEVRGANRHILLAPGINIDRTPLNGRTFEYFSEDPYLTKEMAIPIVDGLQTMRIGACIKHYAVNNQETNRMINSSEVDERTLHEIYLRAFRDVVQNTDPWSLMGSYNRINGTYACENKLLLKDILMDNWGFTGFVVSDWWATKPLTKPENCIKAGLSLEMPKPYAYKIKYLENAYSEGKFTIEELDYVIKRLLKTMFRVGLFDSPKKLAAGLRNTASHQYIAKKIAEEGIVLLKNKKDILPLDLEKLNSIAILGPMTNKRMGKMLYGGSAAVVPPFEISPLKGLKKKVKRKAKITKNAKEADACLLFVGLTHKKGEDCENFDRKSLSLPTKQIELIKNTVTQNPNTIVILISGSPIEMSDWISKIPAIVLAWHPGMMGGDAIANVLFGEVNPSGKLPITFPAKLADSPAHKSEKTYPGTDKVYYEEGIYVGYRHFDQKNIKPLFPFGFGLSYTQFEFSNLKVNRTTMKPKDTMTITVDIKNTGKIAGDEIAQLYVSDDESSIDRPPKELRGFEKIALKPGESRTIQFSLSIKDLMFYDVKSHDWKYEPGNFTISIGNSSRDLYLTQKIILSEK